MGLSGLKGDYCWKLLYKLVTLLINPSNR